MNTLEKELIKNAKVVVSKTTDDLEEVKLLLAHDAKQELETLKLIGLDHNIKLVEAKKSDLLERQAGEYKFGKPVVSLKDIEKLCLEYRLFVRPANQYAGHIPPDLGSEMVRFVEAAGIKLAAHSDHSGFFIIAPPKMFKTYRSPMNVVAHATREVVKEEQRKAEERRKEEARLAEERRLARERDPILVYRMNENYFVVVKSWGDDFTPLRKLYGYLTKKFSLKAIFSTVKLGVVALVQYLWWSTMPTKYWDGMETPWSLVDLLSSAAVIIGCAVWMWNDTLLNIRKFIFKYVNTEDNWKKLNY
jgi:hypothetical protein